MVAPLYHTAEMVRALIDETRHWPRYETVYGELLVTPAPRPWQSVRVPLYWVIDADSATAEVWTPVDQFPRVETERLVWTPPNASKAFEIALNDLLRPI